ncbi:MAG: PP0621 family protein [bacterium]|nr:hypothetical protein [Betaproteobacteria bacterium]
MIKYLVLIAVIAVIVWMVTGKARAAARRDRRQTGRPVEDMVRCAHCGVFLPKAESVEARGARFCSREHERLH